MRKWKRILAVGGVLTCVWAVPALAATEPEHSAKMLTIVSAAPETSSGQTSAYDNIAISKVSGSVNIRTEANTTSAITGKIYNDCAAVILDTVEGEGGKWYKITSGSVTGYIKAEYFVTGSQAESRAREVGTTYGTVSGATSLRLREKPDLTSKTLTLLAEGAHYTVTGEEGDFLKVTVDTDLEGYVHKDYMKTEVSFKEAVSVEEEAAKKAEENQRREEADQAIRDLEQVMKEEAARESAAKETTADEKEQDPAPTIIAVNPEKGNMSNVEAPVTTEEKAQEKETEAAKTTSTAVASATRNAIVAYAKQFIGNPYVYGGTSLTEGADCSGYVMSVFSHFGISTGRSSRDQAARGKTIPVSDVQPGDLLFYASGDYINHVGIYIGGGQIVHASTPASGICTAPSNYRTPCKAVTFID